MATVIDQLVVKLGLDSSDFKKGEKELGSSLDKARKGTEKTARQMKDSGKDAAAFFGELQKSALKFMAALAAGRGLYNFVQNTIKGGASLQRLATNLQTNVDSLHRWGQAVKQNGGTAEGFQATIQSLSAGVTELMRGGNENLRGFLSTLGIGLQDATGKAKSMEQILLDVASAVEAGKLGPSRANQVNFLQQMGLDDGTINLLLKGRKDVEKALAAQTGYNESDAKKALEYEQKWLQAQEKINGYMREITYKLLPSLIPAIDAIGTAVSTMAPYVAKMVDGFVTLNEKTDGWLANLLLALGAVKGISLLLPKAAGGAGAAAGAGAAGGAAAGGFFGKLFKFGVAGAALTYSGDLNSGEEAELARRRSMAPTIDTGPRPSSEPAPHASTKKTRAERNFNPGNLNYAGQAGASLEAGSNARFAKFKSEEEGIAALVRQLRLYQQRGIDTIGEIVKKYAPPSENDTQAYVANMARWTGLSADEKLNFNDTETVRRMVEGISRKEGRYTPLTEGQIMSGINLANQRAGIAGATSIQTGDITINTQATDAAGIARDLYPALVANANSGMR
jgi:hypothetical protein